MDTNETLGIDAASMEHRRHEADAKDAARWRALVTCARVRVLGHAGLTPGSPYAPYEHAYAHIGVELWTRHDAPRDDSERDRRTLTEFADKAVLHAEGRSE